jgi:hypothetical protein
MNDEFKEKRKEGVVACFKVLSQCSSGWRRGGTTKILSRIIGVPAEMRTGDL